MHKNEILKKNTIFNLVFKKGKYYKSRYVNIITYDYEQRLVGFTVERRRHNTIIRNRIRRILREIYRKNKNRFPEKIIIIHAKRFDSSVRYIDLENDIILLLNKINEDSKIYPNNFN